MICCIALLIIGKKGKIVLFTENVKDNDNALLKKKAMYSIIIIILPLSPSLSLSVEKWSNEIVDWCILEKPGFDGQRRDRSK